MICSCASGHAFASSHAVCTGAAHVVPAVEQHRRDPGQLVGVAQQLILLQPCAVAVTSRAVPRTTALLGVTPAGMPILWALANPKLAEREVLTAMPEI